MMKSMKRSAIKLSPFGFMLMIIIVTLSAAAAGCSKVGYATPDNADNGCEPSVAEADEGSQLIEEVTGGESEEPGWVEYRNNEFGLAFKLPQSWDGYSIITGQWEGYPMGGQGGDANEFETGAMIQIRHPQWTEETPRQDVPIMVFTLEQWQSLQKGSSILGAPMNPTELGRNDGYVFALPARYNYSFPEGYEEVEQILESDPIRTFDVA